MRRELSRGYGAKADALGEDVSAVAKDIMFTAAQMRVLSDRLRRLRSLYAGLQRRWMGMKRAQAALDRKARRDQALEMRADVDARLLAARRFDQETAVDSVRRSAPRNFGRR